MDSSLLNLFFYFLFITNILKDLTNDIINTSIKINDPIYFNKQLNSFELFVGKFINDLRDLPFIFLCLKITFIVIPFALCFFLWSSFPWWLALIYYVMNFAFFQGPFILMLHLTSHRPFFKKENSFFNNYIPWILGPLFGETPESYFAHHLGMHHAEENLPDDDSSTMKYQRDSFIDFLKYYFSFVLFGVQALSSYLTRKNRIKIRNKFLTGEISFYVVVAILLYFNWEATLVVFVIPVFLTRFLMMAGNWGQHAFIDPKNPENRYTTSITCINSTYNKTCFNDGYHIGHHLKPAMHWTEYPLEFQKNIEKYITNKAIIFHTIDFITVWLFLMLKKYNWLVKYYVPLENQNPINKNELILLFKERTQKFDIKSI